MRQAPTSTDKLIEAFRKRRRFLVHHGGYDPRVEAQLLLEQRQQLGSKRAREVVLFNHGH
jgi:hypothetical protein